jgi:predicted metal-dependent hydrolase
MHTPERLTVSGIEVEVERKAVKHVHLSVLPPLGAVRLVAPEGVAASVIRLTVIQRLGWIKLQREAFQAQPRETEREMVAGESHYYRGRRYLLRVVTDSGRSGVAIRQKRFLELHTTPQHTPAQRERLLQRWYRARLRALAPPIIARWEQALGVSVAEWGIKRMKTRWGSCNVGARRVWLNLELIKKPPECLDYLILHELAHLVERRHNARFLALLDLHMPTWRSVRARLNAQPLAHTTWPDKQRASSGQEATGSSQKAT